MFSFFRPSVCFLIDLFGILFDVDFNKLFVHFEYQPLIRYIICKKSSPIQQVAFSFFLMVSFVVQKLICLIKSYLFIWFLFSLPVEANLKKKITKTNVKELIACLFIQECYGSRSCVQVFNPSEFISIFGVWKCFTLMLLHVLPSFSNTAY